MDHPKFEEKWPELETQLRAVLTRRRIPIDAREDVLQETALRLLRSWDRVRPESLWAFSLTVALNIVRDEARKKERHDRSCLENPAVDRDPEHEALVRLELERVRVALTSMNERQRTVLLGEIGEAVHEASTPAQKMARLRARRRLRALLEDASALVALPVMKLRRWMHDADAAVANAAASWAVRVATLSTVAAVAVPAAIGSPDALSLGPIEAISPARGDGSVATSSWSFVRRAPSDPALQTPRPISGAVRALIADRRDQVNEHFGVIHKEGDSVVVGGDEQIGPYGIHQKVGQSVGDTNLGAELKARYDAAKCWNKFVQRPHSPCSRGGRLRGRINAAVDGEKKGVIIDSVAPTD
jgi:DNA-directed RNA polymerase specialized sigma24 family protein